MSFQEVILFSKTLYLIKENWLNEIKLNRITLYIFL